MKRFLRLGAVLVLVMAVASVVSFSGPAIAADTGTNPYFDGLTPAPYTTVAPGTVSISAHAYSDAALSNVTLLLNGTKIAETSSDTQQSLAISQSQSLTAGVYTASVTAVDAAGKGFQAEWDFVVSSNSGDSEWFNAAGQPNADQINATMKSLVQAFRWHLYGLSWDNSPHPDLPSHVGFTGTGDPVGPWVTGTTFDEASTQATLRSLVEAFRWHFWGISWDGQNHPDIPTHASTVQPPQSIDPWFTSDGQPIQANITATLRSLVEAFRWHFWGYSWDGSHHPDMPTHASFGAQNPPTSIPTETNTLYQSQLSEVVPFTSRLGSVGTPTSEGYSITVRPNVADGINNGNTNYGDGSYSLTMRKLTADGNAAGCLMFRVVDSNTGGGFYQYCFLYSGNSVIGTHAMYLSGSANSSNVTENDIAQFTFGTPLTASDWNTLKVIAQGSQFWFYANGNYLGTATQSGIANGSLGFSVYNLDTQVNETVEFTNLMVKNIQGSTASTSSTSNQNASGNGSFGELSPSINNLVNSSTP